MFGSPHRSPMWIKKGFNLSNRRFHIPKEWKDRASLQHDKSRVTDIRGQFFSRLHSHPRDAPPVQYQCGLRDSREVGRKVELSTARHECSCRFDRHTLADERGVTARCCSFGPAEK